MGYEVHRVDEGAPPADAYAVRRAVFIEEQDVSEAEEMDGLDDQATHFVAYAVEQDDGDQSGKEDSNGDQPGSEVGNGNQSGSDDQRGRPVGTARLRVPESGVAKPERVAVLEPYRGEGVGQQLMAAVEREAREQGCERARLHAQVAVEEFYRDLGYETTSDVFDEAGIPHVEMEKKL